jgi:hypothetical protein
MPDWAHIVSGDTSWSCHRPDINLLARAACLRFSHDGERNGFRTFATDIQADRSTDFFAAFHDRPTKGRSRLDDQKWAASTRTEKSQIPGTQRQERRQAFLILFIAMRHEDNDILRTYLLDHGACIRCHNVGFWKPFPPGKMRSSIDDAHTPS